MNKKSIVCFGEIMLRLRSPNYTRLLQSSELEASFGGGEANVATSLSILGEKVIYVSSLSKNAIGDAAIRQLKSYNVDTSFIKQTEDRIGIYFLELGSNQRASEVIYDRSNSAASKIKKSDFDWEKIFKATSHFHITGITPAISMTAAEATLEAVEIGKKKGVTISLDINYRKKLWNYGVKAPDVLIPLVKQSDWLLANEEDIQLGLNIESKINVSENYNSEDFIPIIENLRANFPNLKYIAITLRKSQNANSNLWSAILANRTKIFLSRSYNITNIVDRIGAGDAFAAGLIYGINNNLTDTQSLEFATAASALKHSIVGDFNLASKDEIELLVSGQNSGRVRR